MEPTPRIFPLKNIGGEGYLFETNDRSIFPRNADIAFFLNEEWDNNGGYKVNYHPFSTCKQSTAQGSSSTGDEMAEESWNIIVRELTQMGANKGVTRSTS